MEEKKSSLLGDVVRSIFDKHFGTVAFTAIVMTYLITRR
jgi:hypothetical protein